MNYCFTQLTMYLSIKLRHIHIHDRKIILSPSNILTYDFKVNPENIIDFKHQI